MTRLERLHRLIEFYGVTWDDDPDIEENLDKFTVYRNTPSQWAAVTQTAVGTYIYPVYDSKAAAIARANEYPADDLCPEWPVAVVDLDTGETFTPAWTKLPFEPRPIAHYDIWETPAP